LENIFENIFDSDPVSSEFDDAKECSSKAGVDLACRAAVLEADLVPLLEVEKTLCEAGDVHARPPSLAALHLGLGLGFKFLFPDQ